MQPGVLVVAGENCGTLTGNHSNMGDQVVKKFAAAFCAIVVSFAPATVHAGGWGGGGSKPLINVSPSVDVDDVKVLNGIGNGNAILSGNNVSGILNGNKTSVGDILGGLGVGILSGNNSYKLKK
jgi:hypothetical protein